MIVSSELRRPDARDSAADPAPYAYAPTSVSSFVQVLHEIGGQRNREPGVSAAEERHEAAPPKSTENGKEAAERTSTSDTARKPADTSRTTDNESAAGGQTESPDTTGDATDSPETDADGTHRAATVAAGDADTASETTVEANLIAAADSESVPGAAGIVMETIEGGVGVREAALAAAGLHPGDSDSEGTGDTKSAGAGGTASGSPDADGEAPPPANPLPKTLNALLAENALQKRAAGASAAPEARDLAAAAAKVANDRAIDDDPAPPPNPLPRAAAMEIGGVRADAPAVPRIPLANLPGELAQQIHMMQQEGTRTMRIRLVPESLGEIRIEIQGTGDTMRVRMIAATPAARDALESQMGDLRQALQKQGLSLDNFSVDTGDGHRENPFGHERHGGRPAGSIRLSPEPGIGDTTTETKTNRTAEGSGALNVFA